MTLKTRKYHVIQLALSKGLYMPLYVKKYYNKVSKDGVVQETELVSGRTLMVVNIPEQWTEEEFMRVFEPFGAIQSVKLTYRKDLNPSDCRTGFVVYKSEKTIEDGVLKTNQLRAPKVTPKVSGIEAYKQAYYANIPSRESILEEANEYMKQFNLKEEEEHEKKLQLRDVVDDDGFQTVVTMKKRPGSEKNKAPEKKKRRKDHELKNFYRYQVREEKRDSKYFF